MKSSAHRLIFLTLLIALCAAVPASAQKLQIDHLDTLFPKAAETVDVTIDESLIKLAAKFLSSSKPDEAAIKAIVGALKGVYVKGVEFDRDGEYSEADIEKVRTQLHAPGWERIVGVRSRREGDNAEVYMMMQNDVITGVGVIVFSPRELYVVNIVGPIDPEKIGELRGHFGLPNIDFDWSGVGVRRYPKGDK
ncbi:MAG TPA: DUF4252 domain-containing protein [Blastocatellia bacterium]|nr:DUF4252 domain-containing protein [Blastocatellia bacterium]